jgi:hypothetical protein
MAERISWDYLRTLCNAEAEHRRAKLTLWAGELAKLGAIGGVERERDGFERLAKLVDVFQDNEREILAIVKKKGHTPP